MFFKLATPQLTAGSHGNALLYWVAKDWRRRWLVLALLDALLIACAMGIALALEQPHAGWLVITAALGCAIAIKVGLLHLFRLYHVSWSYFSVQELVRLFLAMSVGSAALAMLLFVASRGVDEVLLRGQVLLMDYLLALLLVGGFRSSGRIRREFLGRPAGNGENRVLIAGAGSAGEMVARRLREAVNVDYRAVGFVDDNPVTHGSIIHGVPVLGNRGDLLRLAGRVRPSELWIAMPSASPAVIRETVEIGRKAGIQQIKILPGFGSLLNGQFRLSDMREVRAEDLLGRETVRIDTGQVSEFLSGKRILVTGAAGSIGAELCRQAARFHPSLLVLLDQDETGIFNLQNDLKQTAGDVETFPVVGSVGDQGRMEALFAEFRPQVVLHAAAYKHVPLMEQHPGEAIRTNVFGTETTAMAAKRWGAEAFVLISTDKAVNPTSVMGATKRAAEMITQDLGATGATKFVSVRFGNVLGSRGSVVPIFQAQIARGGPVTVTDPDMRRYFMTIPEAVLLVLQAGAIGHSGQVLVLDMGEPVRIVDLARQMIELSGYEPDRDIPIVFTGLRPGEKLFEDILSAEEGTEATLHDRVFVARMTCGVGGDSLRQSLTALQTGLSRSDRSELVALLREVVPTYQPFGAPSVMSVSDHSRDALASQATTG